MITYQRIDIEHDKYVPTHYALYSSFIFHDNNSIFILNRNNDDARHISITVKPSGLMVVKHNKSIDTFKVELCNINKITAVWKSLNSFVITINGQQFDIGSVMADTNTYINYYNCDIFDYGVKYLNFNTIIPRVYGTCFCNIHTRRAFGKYLYMNGANYYVVNKPALKDATAIINQIYNDNAVIKPTKVYIFQDSMIKTRNSDDLQHLDRLYKLIDVFPDIEFKTCTFFHKEHAVDRYNELLRMSGIPYIDVDALFRNMPNPDDYFIDNSHTNYEGGRLIAELMTKEAPDLIKQYPLEDLNY